MRRREFIAALADAAAWPVVARAREAARRVVGWIGLPPEEVSPIQRHAIHLGRSATGFVAGRNLT